MYKTIINKQSGKLKMSLTLYIYIMSIVNCYNPLVKQSIFSIYIYI